MIVDYSDDKAMTLQFRGDRLHSARFEFFAILPEARTAFAEAATIIQGLAQGIGDEALRMHFLAAPQIHQVMQQAHSTINQLPKDHAQQR